MGEKEIWRKEDEWDENGEILRELVWKVVEEVKDLEGL